MPKIDLHTHSIASRDGAITADDYARMLETGILDYIAVTDHNRIDFAVELQAKLGEQIIVGEEIKTTEGEIIGLYLREAVPALLSPEETVQRIKTQNGLVYVPHPFETVRSGLQGPALLRIIDKVDIIEVGNGRAVFQNRSLQATEWIHKHGIAGAASSDAHARAGWGRTFTLISAAPTRETLVELLRQGEIKVGWPGVRAIAYPKYNRFRKLLGKERP